jgi:GNAT superfamily N-acetyltransferase
MGVTIRPARAEDMPRLWKLVLQLADYEKLNDMLTGSPEALADLLFGDRRGLEGLIAEENGEAIGYALFYDTFSSFRTCRMLWLEDLFVAPDRRGTGAGRALLAEVARMGLARGCRRIDWHVLDWNEPAIGFYRRLGSEHVVSDWLQYRLDEAGMRSLVDGA